MTIIGTGRIGGALAYALLDRDQTVTVWNRTPERAHSLTGRERYLGEGVGATNTLVVAVLPLWHGAMLGTVAGAAIAVPKVLHRMHPEK